MPKNEEITFNLVLATAEKSARDRNVTILEVTNRDVKNILGRGNDGYIGAHLQTVKIQYAQAKLLSEKQVSHQLNAAIYNEIKRFTDNSREVATSEAAVTQQMFDEVCERNIELEEALDSKIRQLSEQLHVHTEQTLHLETEIHTSQIEKTAIEAVHNSNLQSKNQVEITLGEAQGELGALKNQLGQFETQRAEQDAVTRELQEELKLLKQENDTARDSHQKAEQRAELLTWKNEQFMKENEGLKEKLELAIERSAIAEAQLQVVKKTKTKTTAN